MSASSQWSDVDVARDGQEILVGEVDPRTSKHSATLLPVVVTDLKALFDEPGVYHVRISINRSPLINFASEEKIKAHTWVTSDQPISMNILTRMDPALLVQVFQKTWRGENVLCSWTEFSIHELLQEGGSSRPLFVVRPPTSWFPRLGPELGAGNVDMTLRYIWNEQASPAFLSAQRIPEIPTFAQLRLAILAVASPLTANASAELIVRVHLDALWTTLSQTLKKALEQWPLRIPADLLWQLCEQILFLKATHDDTTCPHTPQYQQLADDMMDAISKSVTLTYSFADSFESHATTYQGMDRGGGKKLIDHARACHLRLLRLRIAILLLWKGQPAEDLPGGETDAVTTFLLNRSLTEDWENPALDSFTSVLYCLRGRDAEYLLDRMVEAYASLDSQARDITRRMMAHLMQKSHAIPHLIDIPLERLSNPPDLSVTRGRSEKEGASGSVYRAQMQSDGAATWRTVAVKVLKMQPNKDVARQQQQAYIEAMNSWILDHKNILKTLGVTYDWGSARTLSIVLPWLKHGNSADCLHKWLSGEKAHERPIVEYSNAWTCQVADALAYLHSEDLVHGDLRGVNILIDQGYNALISDFGLTIYANGQSKNYFSTRSSNSFWLSPELLSAEANQSTRPTKEADVYSFALLCIELYTGYQPWYPLDPGYGLNLMDLLKAGGRPQRPMQPGTQPPTLMEDALWALVCRCWVDSAEARPIAQAVFEELLGMLKVEGGRSPTFPPVEDGDDDE